MRLGRFCAVFTALCACTSLASLAEAQVRELRVPADQPPQQQGEQSLHRPSPPPPAKNRVIKPEVFYCETADTSCRTTQNTFPLADLRDLFVFVVWPGVTGQHIQTVQFLLPDGTLFCEKKTSFSVGGATSAPVFATQARREVSPPAPAPQLIADGNKVHAEGIPRLLTSSRNEPALLTVLPVAGTYITLRNLSGTWRVRVLLDDQPAVESTFVLTPRSPATSTQEGEDE
jgi:hypothetical protein